MRLKKFEQGLTDYIFGDARSGNLVPVIKAYSEDELNARLSIYKNNVFSSLVDAMSDVYPAVIKTVGDDFFRASARIYLTSYPPRRASLIELGYEYPRFLESFGPARSLSYLPDVARIDLACHQAYHAADANSLSAEDFGGMDAGVLAGSQLTIHPSTHLLTSVHACFSIWSHPPETGTEIRAETPEHVLIVRPETEVNTYSLSYGSYCFIRDLIAGCTLGEALGAGMAVDDSFNPTQAVQFLIQSGLATKITGDQCP